MRSQFCVVGIVAGCILAVSGASSCADSDGDTDVVVQTSCPAGQTMCNGLCADLTRDPLHCGQCSVSCAVGEVCFASSCDLSCPGGLAECAGTCVNTNNDREHCGGCDTPCGDGEVCSVGACSLSCQDGLTDCDGYCVDTDSDRDHCGSCNAPCGGGEVCSVGACALSCQAELTDCDGSCVNTDTDRNHCGQCGTVCATPRYCEEGDCVDPENAIPVELQFVSVSDWHGQLDSFGVGYPAIQVGGAAVLSAYFEADRAANPNTITLAAGDSFGASPPLSGFFDEEPTVESMNLMGFDAAVFGNHGFDRGLTHLQSMIGLADYRHVSSNLGNLGAELTDVEAPYYLLDVDGVRVAIIGIETPETPELVFPGRMETLTVTDPVDAALDARDAAAAEGATVFVAVTHIGADGYDPHSGLYDGPLVDFASAVTGFQLIIGGHTHMTVNTTIGGAIVMQSGTKGSTYARASLVVVPYNGAVVESHAEIVTASVNAVTPDPELVALLEPYRTTLAVEMDAEIGVAQGLFERGSNIERLQEVALGNLTCDAMRDRYGTDFAVTNGGGLRASLPSSYAPADLTLRRLAAPYVVGPPYDLVKGDVFAVLPYGNIVVTREITGTTLWAMLENGVSSLPAASGKFLQISGFKFTYNDAAAVGSRVVSVAFPNNTPIPEDGTLYTLATNDFMNSGGDGYTMLADGEGAPRDVMADVLLDYITAHTPIAPTTDGRIAEAN